jgi:integrase
VLVGAEGKAAVALRFLIFTVCGTNEVTGARWDEIDRPRAVWKIPGERMKMDEDHSVPLTAPALAILDEMRDGGQGDLIFPAADDQPFSDMAMLAVLDRLGYGHVTVHGLPRDVRDLGGRMHRLSGRRPGKAALAHKYKNETIAAYQHGEKLEKRRALMADWAAFVLNSNIVPITGRARA